MLRTLTFAALSAAALAAPLTVASPAFAGGKGCPPGLAKKNEACMPPGQYKKLPQARHDHDRYDHDRDRDRDRDVHYHRYDRGERIRDNYIVIRDPGRYQLDPRRTYYNVDDYVYRVDPDTGAVLDIIGGIAQLSK